MKIALIIKFFSRSKGGAERYAVHLAGVLRREGHEVHIFANRWEEPAETGLIFHRVPMGRGPAVFKLFFFHWMCRRQLRRERFDLVHAVAQTYPVDLYRMSDGLFRHWLSLQYPNGFQRFLRCLLRPVYFFNLSAEKKILGEGGCRLLVANSDLCRRQALDYYSVSPDRIDLIYNSVDLLTFHPGVKKSRSEVRKRYGIDPNAPLLLFSAMNFSRKGLAELIRCLPFIRPSFPGIRLMIIGRGDLRRYRSLARRAGVEETLVFREPVETLAPFYGAADLFVLPTHYDPFANVCLEAMACGLPVVTTRQNGAAELIEEGVNGFTIEAPHQIEALAQKVGQALLHHAEMGAKAAETARSFSPDHHLQKVLKSYDRLMSKKISEEMISKRPWAVVNQPFSDLLKQNHLFSYREVMAYKEGLLLKRLRARTVTKVSFRARLQEPKKENEFYLKRYQDPRSLLSLLRRLSSMFFPGGGFSDGRMEWENIVAFHRADLPTMVPVAAGEERSIFSGGSFLLTEAIVGYESLEAWVPSNLGRSTGRKQFELKRRLIQQVALLSRKMHQAGFYHRDFYLTHILLKIHPEGFDLKVIDLQRGIRSPFFKKRWKVKDLASLNYSSPRPILTRQDRLFFYKWYRGVTQLKDEDRRFIREIEQKTAQIERHTMKRYQKRQEQKRLGLLGR